MPADLLASLGLVPAAAAAPRAAASDDRAALSKRARAQALAVARAPVPIGLRAIHPTWIEAGLAGLPDRARAAVASAGGSAGDSAPNPVDVWLARAATAHLPPMIVEPALAALLAGHPAWLLVDGIPTAPVAALVAWLDGIGADQLALATGTASEKALARLGDAPARIQRAPRKGQLGSQRAAIARCTGVPMDELAHVRIGARALAPRLAALAPHSPTPPIASAASRVPWLARLAPLQLAVRLPRPLGLVVYRELVAHATAAADAGTGSEPGNDVDAPTWLALLA